MIKMAIFILVGWAKFIFISTPKLMLFTIVYVSELTLTVHDKIS